MATNPTLLAMPLAENGTKNVIPETQATAGDGLFSQSTGFPAETSLPLGAGGVAPSREDFNGMANLLGGVAFYAQKGFTFNYDATQDYYAGCVVIDGGNRYLCIADMAAGTIAPSADTAHTYWTFYPVGVINKRDVITISGTYTAPVTGWYKITVKGGGGGGYGGAYTSAAAITYIGGGEGGTTIGYEKMTAGQTASVVIGAGGAGGSGHVSSTTVLSGTDGGDSTVTVNNNTYTGGGGFASGAGGNGTIRGASGSVGSTTTLASISVDGGCGGGSGGGTPGGNGVQGGGGGAGNAKISAIASAGGRGGDGYVWFEYFDGSLN